MSQRVLVVDDEKTFRLVCTTALANEGYEVRAEKEEDHPSHCAYAEDDQQQKVS